MTAFGSILLLLLTITTTDAPNRLDGQYPFASTSFEDCLWSPYSRYFDTGDPDVDRQLFNNEFDPVTECSDPRVEWTSTGDEIGFTTWYTSTGGDGLTDPDGDYFGITEYTGYFDSYVDGQRGYQMCDTDGIVELRFDTVTNSDNGYWDVAIDLHAVDTEWENSDSIRVSVLVDDKLEFEIFAASGDDIEAIAGVWIPLQFELTSFTTARLSVWLESSVDDECLYIDDIRFNKICEPLNSNTRPTQDCNANGIEDSCEIQVELASDCNGNDIPDSCDIADGLAEDSDLNGIPDECEGCATDVEDDGLIDVNDILAAISSWGDCGSNPPLRSSNGLLDRRHPGDLRIMTWNLENLDTTSDPAIYAPYSRVLQAIDADVIVFQEFISENPEEELRNWLETYVDSGPWYIHAGIETNIRNMIASKYELDMLETQTTPPPVNSPRGATMARVDCPDQYWNSDLYLIGVHFKAFGDCDSELKRQGAADSITNWIGDLTTSGGEVDLPVDTPILVLGDLNFYSEGHQPERTLLTGDIVDESRFGSDIAGDWDGTGLADLRPAQLVSGETWTLSASSSYAASRTDRIITTNSVVDARNMFVLNTTVLPEDVLDHYGLQLDDTTRDVSSDHLPVVLDIRDRDYCPADVDGDDVVGVNDILAIIASWGPCL